MDTIKELEINPEDLKDPHIYASLRDFSVLKDSIAWGDIKRRLLCSLVSKRNELETLGEEHVGNAMALVGALAHIQGEVYQIRLMLELPDRLSQQKEMENEDESSS